MTTRQLDPTVTPSWAAVHARTAAVREVVVALDAGFPLPDRVDGTAGGPFADRDELLLALHGVWSRRLGGHVDIALETGDGALAEGVARAWLATAADLPGVRRVLDENAGRPALLRAVRHEHRALAVAAGRATFDDPVETSAAAGARLVAAARSRSTAPVVRLPWWRRLAG